MTVPAQELTIRIGVLYLPFVLTCAAWMWRRPERAESAGVLLACFWNLVALLALHTAAGRFDWWQFRAAGPSVAGFPIDFYLGWTLLWGAAFPLVFRQRTFLAVAAGGVVDVLLMPLLTPLLQLGDKWLMGEALALAFVLAPGMLLADWTRRKVNLPGRVLLQFLCFAGLTGFAFPMFTAAYAGRGLLAQISAISSAILALSAQVVLLVSVPGLAALREFAERGAGTPFPLDPPGSLVRSGPYAYLANPMQVSGTCVLVVLSVLLRDVWLALGAVSVVVYCIGIAAWDEDEDLKKRLGKSWLKYRAAVRAWLPRWRPYPLEGTLYVAESCGPCSEVKAWFESKKPVSLRVLPAESFPEPLERITYVRPDGSRAQGVAAIASAMEHIHLGYAYASWFLRLPLVQQVAQLLADASGGERRRITAWRL